MTVVEFLPEGEQPPETRRLRTAERNAELEEIRAALAARPGVWALLLDVGNDWHAGDYSEANGLTAGLRWTRPADQPDTQIEVRLRSSARGATRFLRVYARAVQGQEP